MKKSVIKTLPFIFFLIGMLISCENPVGDPQEENTAEIKVTHNSQVILHEGKLENLLNDIYVNTNVDDFGELPITIENTGTSELRLTGAPEIIKLSGATGVFKVSSQPAQTALKQGQKTTFTLRFKPTNTNQLDVTVIIPNSSKNAPEFTFRVYGQGKKEKPEIRIFNGNTEIPADGTISFGEALVSRSTTVSITVKNTGRLPLELTGDPLIKVSGTDADDFTVETQPTKNISAGGSSSFDVKFTPDHEGESGAIVTIDNNDSAFRFYINGTGKREYPVIELKNNDEAVAHEETKAFGTVETGKTKTEAFTLKNTGQVALELTGTPVVQSSNPDRFSISTQPSKIRLEPNEMVQFAVTYTPNTEQLDDEADITIMNNSETSLFTFKVSGGPLKAPIALFDENAEIAQNATVDMGTVIISQYKDKVITIKNTGDGVLTIDVSNIRIEGTGVAAFSIPNQPRTTVLAGGTTSFTLRYTPGAASGQEAAVSIPSNDKSRNPAVFTVTGTGRREYPAIELTGNSAVILHNGEHHFGAAETGKTKMEGFTIKNTGLATLELTGTPLVQSSNPDRFSITTPPSKTTIEPGETASFAVTYTPGTGLVIDEADISIMNNSQTGLFTFKVTGSPSISLRSALTWLDANAEEGGGYTIALNANETITAQALSYSGKNVRITLSGGSTERTVMLSSSGSLFTVGSGVTLTLGNNVTLYGRSNNTASLVTVNDGGMLVMDDGSKVSGNSSSASGGGVHVAGGTFTMNGGEINGNSTSVSGGGAYVEDGAFTMNGGEINGNSASVSGGGVYVAGGTFIKRLGGVIYGSDADSAALKNTVTSGDLGHAAYVEGSPAKKRNTTADAAVALNSGASEEAGGWKDNNDPISNITYSAVEGGVWTVQSDGRRKSPPISNGTTTKMRVSFDSNVPNADITIKLDVSTYSGYAFISQLDNASATASSGYFNGSRISSTQSVEITIPVPTVGSHFIDIGYYQSYVGSSYSNCAWFKVVGAEEPTTNTPVSNITYRSVSGGDWTLENDGRRKSPYINSGTTTKMRVSFDSTVANSSITIQLDVSSESGCDFAFISQLDTASATATSGYFNGTVISGTNSVTVTIPVPTAGSHFIDIGYQKDPSYIGGSDCAWFTVIQ